MIKSPLTRFIISIEVCADDEELEEDNERETPHGKEPIKPTTKRMYRAPKDLINEHK
jgi:hypothetical protein